MHDQLEREYFQREIAPHLGDDIEYLGEVSHEEKVRLLQRARCTLFPIAWEEPFGLVMIESMACGTPVVATRFGAVPEVIGDGGEGGIIVDDLEDMASAVAVADEIDPAACRAYAEERFSERRMVRSYLEASGSCSRSRAALTPPARRVAGAAGTSRSDARPSVAASRSMARASAPQAGRPSQWTACARSGPPPGRS